MAFMGPVVLGMLALTTEDPNARDGALAEAEPLLATGSVSHNHLLFRKDAIEACLAAGVWDDAEHHAAALDAFAGREPLPWTEFVVARGCALAAADRGRRDAALLGELGRLREEGERPGLRIALPTIDDVSAGWPDCAPPPDPSSLAEEGQGGGESAGRKMRQARSSPWVETAKRRRNPPPLGRTSGEGRPHRTGAGGSVRHHRSPSHRALGQKRNIYPPSPTI